MSNNVLFERITELCGIHGGLRKGAKALGISSAFLSQLRSGKKHPSDETLRKLGLRGFTVYVTVYERISNEIS